MYQIDIGHNYIYVIYMYLRLDTVSEKLSTLLRRYG